MISNMRHKKPASPRKERPATGQNSGQLSPFQITGGTGVSTGTFGTDNGLGIGLTFSETIIYV